jgi:hypothetical protein
VLWFESVENKAKDKKKYPKIFNLEEEANQLEDDEDEGEVFVRAYKIFHNENDNRGAFWYLVSG